MSLKIKRSNALISVGIISLFFWTSCEGGTFFTKTIDNKSSETITVKLFTIYGDNNTVMINSNEAKEIYWDDHIGSFVDENYNCTEMIDSVVLSISSGKKLTKDIMNPDQWIRNSKGGRNAREDCVFTITNNDFQ